MDLQVSNIGEKRRAKREGGIPKCAMPHHSSVKPHEGTGGRTPAEFAGTDARANNKRRAPIQDATGAA